QRLLSLHVRRRPGRREERRMNAHKVIRSASEQGALMKSLVPHVFVALALVTSSTSSRAQGFDFGDDAADVDDEVVDEEPAPEPDPEPLPEPAAAPAAESDAKSDSVRGTNLTQEDRIRAVSRKT